ncbi:pyridoxamine 5'-phosphate oxidase family protein [Microbacterium aurantiacum]|uniref:pyridoxamine 5'-phosphate oxidase family protein n=1 Tax=Microbacterium aurantiacum TaxID=162393 RepID=UPI001F47320D|nr:pyridoxamine 5'-phosphate oxidase family protein [Microbacterium aurantiacum]
MHAPSPEVEVLEVAECWRLLRISHLGRIAVVDPDGSPDLFPVNYVAGADALFLRTAPGAKLDAFAAGRPVAFEIDRENHGDVWSVVVRGRARILDTDAEVEASGVRGLRSAGSWVKNEVVRVDPDRVSGRRFLRASRSASRNARRNAPPGASGPADSGAHEIHDAHDSKPKPIPHLPPRPGGSAV